MKKSLKVFGALLCSVAGTLLFTMCGGAAGNKQDAAGTTTTKPAEPSASTSGTTSTKTISFWHLDTTAEQQAAWRKIADNFEAKHPGVKIEITCLENEAFKQKVATAMQSNNPPDIFRSWGGGVMIDQAEAGMLRDISSYIKSGEISKIGKGALGVYGYDGKQYGTPYSLGVVGLWYNTKIFEECGLTPADFSTWSKFLASCKVIKSKGYYPVALGGADKWPGHYWWTYLAQRLGGEKDFLAAYNGTGAFNQGSFLKAMEMLKEFVDTKPFQDGFLANTMNDECALVADRKAAMDLMGQWAPSAGRDNSADGKGDPYGFMSFPAVEGGNGLLSDTQGGGDGYVIGANAPDEAIELLKSFYEPENYKIICTTLNACPVIPGYEDLVDDNMKVVAKAVKDAGYYQLYYDQFLPTAVGEDIKDATQGIYAGTLTPKQACDKIQASWEANK